MKPAPHWTAEQLTAETRRAREIFREERLREPLEKWKETFDQKADEFRQLLDMHGVADLAALTPAKVAEIFQTGLGDALRYLAAPPISEDDLRVLAEASLAPTVVAKDADAAQRILETILQAVDPKRFPWISEKRTPTKHEKAAAILASAVLITAQRVKTDRSNEGKEAQEGTVKAFLREMEFVEVPARTIRTLDDAPKVGEFCAESLVGSRKADIPVRLFDGRLMPIECKVSNSSANSVKRLNNDAEVKAGIWHREFGTRQVVPAAVLSGVFKVHNLQQAQTGGLSLFWAHKLMDMRAFIESTRS